MEPVVNTEPAPRPQSQEYGKGQLCRLGSRGTPVAVVIVVRVAQGEGQAGLALRVLLLTLPGGTGLEEVRDVVDLEKNNGFGVWGRWCRAQQEPSRAAGCTGGHSQ